MTLGPLGAGAKRHIASAGRRVWSGVPRGFGSVENSPEAPSLTWWSSSSLLSYSHSSLAGPVFASVHLTRFPLPSHLSSRRSQWAKPKPTSQTRSTSAGLWSGLGCRASEGDSGGGMVDVRGRGESCWVPEERAGAGSGCMDPAQFRFSVLISGAGEACGDSRARGLSFRSCPKGRCRFGAAHRRGSETVTGGGSGGRRGRPGGWKTRPRGWEGERESSRRTAAWGTGKGPS